MRGSRPLPALLAVLSLVVLAACSPPVVTNRFVGTLVIYASTSLAEPFDALANAFSTAHPGLDVKVTYGPDTELAARTPAPDILAVEGVAALTGVSTLGDPLRFASNQLVLAIPPANPLGITGLADLARPELRVLLCEPKEPCGAATGTLLTVAGVSAPTAARAPDVRTILTAVAAGTADVGVVYRSDIRLAGATPAPSPTNEVDQVLALEVIQSREAITTYCAVIPAGSAYQLAAQGFLDYLGSAPVLDALTGFGFQAPQL